MKIQNIHYYKSNINSHTTVNKRNNSKNTTPEALNSERRIFAYRDYNISFSGRTPENFYEQDFNIQNMPDSMKTYLNYDYETRRHIPPEQMMREVFKYIEIADNFDNVKEIYPNEKLFQSLHENYQKNRTTILGEIKLAKEMSDEPLLKDGSNNFGMYLLKKVYLEGKTLKEINKDFYEKDMNAAYKGIITRQIDSGTTSAYGIQYPNLPFWHSFIATRDEYRKFFVTLPKNSINPAAKIKQAQNSSSPMPKEQIKDKEVKPRARRYKIKDYQKKQLANDIKEAKANAAEVEKKIRRRFAQDDPEVSFIVKYLSPIMAVAADRVHLSEEMRAFCENERINGIDGDEEYMFSRFWKRNPQVLNNYAQTITDTIDLFEEIYGEGGIIPINKDLVIIKPDTENQRVVDHVSPEFLELLDFTQTIMPEREERYKQHDIQQKLWEEHFINRYGKPDAEIPLETEKLIDTSDNVNNLPEIETKTTEPKRPENIQKEFIKALKTESDIYPDLYAEKYVNYMKNNKNIDDNYKLAYMYYAGNETYNHSTLTKDEFIDKFSNLEEEFVKNNEKNSLIAKCAIIDILAKNKCRDARLYGLYTYELPNMDRSMKIFQPIIKRNQEELNRLYSYYLKPMKQNEINQAINNIMSIIINYEPSKEKLERNNSAILEMMRDACKNPLRHNVINEYLKKSITTKTNQQAKLLLKTTGFSTSELNGRLENVMLPLNLDLIMNAPGLLLQMIGKENFQKYAPDLSDTIKTHLIWQSGFMQPGQREFYEITDSDVKKDPQIINKFGLF